MQAAGLYGQLSMVLRDIVVPEKRLPRDHMQVQRMQVADILGQVRDGIVVELFRQRMLKWDVDGAVTIFYIENHGIAACLFPMADQLNTVGAARGPACKVDGADFSIFGEGARFFHDW